ncbi:hypothetical protein BGZ51_008773 [Haplosporangium sp. Z 767]|nr:hypothetical protein BGZ51_008773 [Haplosporangium sp. Z 767]
MTAQLPGRQKVDLTMIDVDYKRMALEAARPFPPHLPTVTRSMTGSITEASVEGLWNKSLGHRKFASDIKFKQPTVDADFKNDFSTEDYA